MDDAAFAAMLVNYRPLMLRVAASVVGDDEAEDAAQEATMLAWRRRASFDGTTPAGWLTTLTRNRCIDLTRRRQFVTVALDHLPERGDPAQEPEPSLLAREVGEAILSALATLSDRQADAVWRCCAEGQTYDQAAAATGVPKTTIRMRLNAGRSRLRALLAGV